MTDDETTTEQLVEIEGQAESTPATEYTPPEGWRVVRFGEELLPGDMWVNQDGTEQRSAILHWDASAVSGGRCIRRIKPQPQPIQVREGRWRTRGGDIKHIRPCKPLQGPYCVWPWTDGFMMFQDNGLHQGSKESPNDLVEYLGPIEPDKTQELETKTQELPAATIEELRSEVSYVQNLLGTEKRRVAQLEDLVASLRTINEAQEKAFEAAGQHNGDLQSRLNAVCSEWSQQAETIRRLQIELDAAQQVPPAIVDRFKEGWNQGTARAVEAIAEWLEPIRLVDSAYLANATMQHLPQIMRHLTGLDSHAID